MDDQFEEKKDQQPIEKEAVDKMDNPVDNTDEAVENPLTTSETVPEETPDITESVDNSVDNSQVAVGFVLEEAQKEAFTEDNPVEAVEETIQLHDEVDLILEQAKQEKRRKAGILVALLLILCGCFFLYQWLMGQQKDNSALAYAKDNALYTYDLKHEPKMVFEGISDGGAYNYYYAAWGAGFQKDSSGGHFLGNVDENNVGDLYSVDAKSGDCKLIDEDVLDYVSADKGTELLYVKEEAGAGSLYLYYGEQMKIATNVSLAGDAFGFNKKEKFIYYLTEDGKLYAYQLSTGQETMLGEKVSGCFLAKESNTLYFAAVVTSLDEAHNALYRYEFGKSVETVLDESVPVSYFEVLPDGETLLYCIMEGTIPYTDLIEDDVTDLATAAHPEVVGEVREAMEEGLGIESILQKAYLMKGKDTIEIDKSIIGLVALDDDSGFTVGYAAEAPEKIKLSTLTALEDVEYQYFTHLITLKGETFLVDKNGDSYVLSDTAATPATIRVSGDGARVAYLSTDPATGDTVLKTEILGEADSAVVVAKNVDEMDFLGDGQQLAYYYDYNAGGGRLALWETGESTQISSNVVGVFYAKDDAAVYYVNQPDPNTGRGDLCMYRRGQEVVLQKDTFGFQYRGNGRVAIVTGYDFEDELGDLYYWNGDQSVELDTDITAVYMY